MSDIMASLPTNGQGGFFNAGGPGATGLLTSSDQLIDWLSQTIVPALFQDAVCGDGQCDADEDSGLGRFGWYYCSVRRFEQNLDDQPPLCYQRKGLRQGCIK
jgi:hypothetical protein